MAKRGAATELTDRNWDQEDEPEEAGEFSKASDEQLKSRHIIKARRTNAPKESMGSQSAFSGFGGFAFKPTQTSTPLFAGGGLMKTESKIPPEEKKEAVVSKPTEVEKSPTKRTKLETNGNGQTNGSSNQDNYLSNLKALNMSVLNWIKQHLDKNPYCILTPIFKDYENHLGQLENSRNKSEENGSSSLKKEESVKPMEEDEKPVPKTGLTFGIGNLNTVTEGARPQPTAFSGFSFKTSTSSSATSAGGFSFAVGSSQPSTSSGASGEGGEDEEYVPPVVEAIEHKEDGALYSKKCKLFYQKDGAWMERGVGFLHLKKLDGKAQLLVRADTTLGNILLNIRLSESVPLSRQGKNNVSLMCVVNPAIPKVSEDKPIPMLIRVKTAEDADELLEKMKEIRS